MLQVFRDHELVGEFPSDHTLLLEGEDLLVMSRGKVVSRYKEGAWHGAGLGIACGFAAPNSKCQRCFPDGGDPTTSTTTT